MFRNKVSRIDWHPLCPPPRSISNKEYLADRIRMTRRIRQDDNQTGMHVTRARHCYELWGPILPKKFELLPICHGFSAERMPYSRRLRHPDAGFPLTAEFGAAYSMWSLS